MLKTRPAVALSPALRLFLAWWVTLSHLERGSYRNRFAAVRLTVPVVPMACSTPGVALASGPQTALVVGLASEAVTTKRNHLVKARLA